MDLRYLYNQMNRHYTKAVQANDEYQRMLEIGMVESIQRKIDLMKMSREKNNVLKISQKA